MPVAAFIRRSWVSWQISFRSRTSRGRPGCQVAPVRAWPGQRWTQREQPLHWLSSTGGSQGRGGIGDQAGQAHRAAIRPGDQQAALAHPTQPRPGGHRLVGQRGGPAIILDHGRSGLGPGPVARLLQEVRPPGHDPVQLGIEGVVGHIIGPGGGGLQRPDQSPGQGHQHRHPSLQPRGDQPPEVRHPHLGRPFRRQTAEKFLFQFLCLLHRCRLLPVFSQDTPPPVPCPGLFQAAPRAASWQEAALSRRETDQCR